MRAKYFEYWLRYLIEFPIEKVKLALDRFSIFKDRKVLLFTNFRFVSLSLQWRHRLRPQPPQTLMIHLLLLPPTADLVGATVTAEIKIWKTNTKMLSRFERRPLIPNDVVNTTVTLLIPTILHHNPTIPGTHHPLKKKKS